MKYHQLVPVRAIFALSDWLVSNLEELGVEAPLAYSRLLLSFLHTTFSINTIEQAADIPYFKEFITLNKSHQLSQLDTEELKKFAAVNLLTDATNNTLAKGQDNSTIIDLVNELYKRIRDIQKESTSVASETPKIDNSEGTEVAVEANFKNINDIKQSLASCSIEDLTKKYYSAFPALDKQFGGNKISGSKPSSTSRVNKAATPHNLLSWSNVFNKTAMNKQSSEIHNSLKRKTKRKRSGKGRSFYMKKQPSDTEPLWDMNFEGNWEMGQDLISEFFNNHQSYQKRNRSISEGDVIFKREYASGQILNDFNEDGFRNTNNKYNKQKRHQSFNNNNNNNDKHVKDLYSNTNYYNTKENLASYSTTEIEIPEAANMKSEKAPPNDNNYSLMFNQNVVNVDKMHMNEQQEQQQPQNQHDYLSVLKAKFNNIKAIWGSDTEEDVVDSACGPSRNVWEPLSINESQGQADSISCYDNNDTWSQSEQNSVTWTVPIAQSSYTQQYRDTGAPKLERDYDFIKCGTNLQTSIWSNDGIEEATSIAHDTLNCREIFDQASDTDSNYFSSMLSNALPAVGAIIEKRNSYISLSNHSEHSMFTEVISSKKGSQNNLNSKASSIVIPANDSIDTVNNDADSENLLTSEKTHFKPISYPDGYTFDISNNLDNVNFYRSESGSLYLDSEKYMELKLDGYSNICEVQPEIVNLDSDDDMQTSNTEASGRFVVKFCVKKEEKCCQTDENDFEEYDTLEVNNALEYNFRTSWRISEQILSDTHIDPMDDCLWSNTEGHNNNHTQPGIWEACLTCQDSLSFPANRRLKDELHADGEEILSDLNYFQSLIISNDWEDDALENDMLKNEEYNETDNIIDRSRVYDKVDKFVSNLLKPGTAESLAKALDNNSDWENVTETDLFSFAYLFNCQSKDRQYDSNDLINQNEKIDTDNPPTGQIQKAPPDKQLNSSIAFQNFCNYVCSDPWKPDPIDVLPIKLVTLQNAAVVRSSRLDRKRRHSACRNLYNTHFRHVKLSNYDASSDVFKDDGVSALATTGNLLINTSDFGTNDFNANKEYFGKDLATDASIIFKNNNLLLKQIDITRPLTR